MQKGQKKAWKNRPQVTTKQTMQIYKFEVNNFEKSK